MREIRSYSEALASNINIFFAAFLNKEKLLSFIKMKKLLAQRMTKIWWFKIIKHVYTNMPIPYLKVLSFSY